jgi:A/G-specific adenine glycosylase
MNKREKDFVARVRAFYAAHGRHDLLWRKTADPYRILVSEMMLQQTQVERVIPKYTQFLETFPTVQDLSKAQLKTVLSSWQGLGYNRRAKLLHACAQTVCAEYGGVFPRAHHALVALPGIGPYTASAVVAFAYNEPAILIETNVRSVYLHHFFKDNTEVSDAEILKLIKRTLPETDYRTWYWALMDYGSFIKKTYGNPNTRSAHYVKQSTFKGSNRQMRGAIIRALIEGPQTRASLHKLFPHDEDARLDAQIERLIEEGMITRTKGRLMLP